MAIPVAIPPLRTYYDPALWDRLLPVLVKTRQDHAGYLVEGKFKTLEEARERIGFIRGLDWVLQAADEFSKIEE